VVGIVKLTRLPEYVKSNNVALTAKPEAASPKNAVQVSNSVFILDSFPEVLKFILLCYLLSVVVYWNRITVTMID
jgi:hypothetical protein